MIQGNLEQFLERLLDRVEGLRTVVVSDRDGVPLIYVGQPLPSDGCLSSVFPMAADQAGKLNLGKYVASRQTPENHREPPESHRSHDFPATRE